MNFIYGFHAVTAALENGSVQQLWLARKSDPRQQEILQTAKKYGVRVQQLDQTGLEKMVGNDAKHQGIVAEVREREPQNETALYALLDSLPHAPLVLALDCVQDPRNLGACLRSADGAGVDAVIWPHDKSAPLTAIARKTACGAAESVATFTVTNLSQTLKSLQKRGLWITGLAGEATENIYETDLTGGRVIVMGAEETGLRRLTREYCDTLAKLPMYGTVSSLNVSVACGIALFEARRQRERPKKSK